MNQIDEAFIHAYSSSPQRPAGAPGTGEVPVVPMQPPLAGLHHGPHFRASGQAEQPKQSAPDQQVVESPTLTTSFTTSTTTEQPTTHWSPEPLPAPHIQIASPSPSMSMPAVATDSKQVETTGPTTERRPLSTFSAPEPPPTTAFNPAYEVDAFRWPKITDQLLSEFHELMIPVAEYVLDANEQGRSLVGIAGTRPNVGCSTMLLSLARLIGSVGKTVALVDANFAKASLARDLGLEISTGWEQALTGELPLAECVVKSLEDRMALLPLSGPNPNANKLLNNIQTSVTAGVLRYHYDLVLFNLGAAAEAPQDFAAYEVMQHCRLDANLIIADTENTGIEPMDTLISLFGENCLGVIGNSAA